jgi:hypothetical protein
MICLVCASSNLSELKNPRRTFFRCNECGFSFLHPDFLPDEETARNRYKLHQNDDDNEGYRDFLSKIIDRALFYAGKAEHVIDWGSGPNPLASRILREKRFSVFSWDPNFSSNEKTQKSFYDLGISIEVAEHFINPQKDFSAFFETLKTGAFAAIHTHLAPEDDEAFLRWWYTEDITHVSFYSKRSLEILGAKNDAELAAVENNKFVVFKLLPADC